MGFAEWAAVAAIAGAVLGLVGWARRSGYKDGDRDARLDAHAREIESIVHTQGKILDTLGPLALSFGKFQTDFDRFNSHYVDSGYRDRFDRLERRVDSFIAEIRARHSLESQHGGH